MCVFMFAFVSLPFMVNFMLDLPVCMCVHVCVWMNFCGAELELFALDLYMMLCFVRFPSGSPKRVNFCLERGMTLELLDGLLLSGGVATPW